MVCTEPDSVVNRQHELLIPHSGSQLLWIINPRGACAVRITVLGLSVSQSVSASTIILGTTSTRRPISDTNGFTSSRVILLKRQRSRDTYAVKTNEKA